MTSAAMLVEEIHFTEVDSLPTYREITGGDLFALRLSNTTTRYTHGLHRFPAKFIPHVPGWALDNFATRESLILDPFMGSGTTLVEAKVRGMFALGFDIDPLARLIASAKAADLDPRRLATLRYKVDSLWRGPAITPTAPMPDVLHFEHWFRPEQWGWLQSLYGVLLSLECTNEERGFLMVIFSSILRWVSNSDDQSQKTYVSGTHQKEPPDVPSQFWKALARAIKGIEDLNASRAPGGRVVIPDDADATNMGLTDASVDLIVTSPPYLDSVDYQYNMMMEYFWLGPMLGIPTRRAFNQLRRRSIGSKLPQQTAALPDELRELLSLAAVSPSRRSATASYFSLMQRHFFEAAKCLKRGGKYVLVVGNSQSQESVLPVHDALVMLAAQSGLHVDKAFGYRVRRHYMKFPRSGRGGIILLDWVIVLEKSQNHSGPPAPLPLPWATLRPDAVAN